MWEWLFGRKRPATPRGPDAPAAGAPESSTDDNETEFYT
jgi:hypothetical protein